MSTGYAGLKTRLDRVFSEFVRREHADRQGYVACVTCHRKCHWKSMTCGHFVSRVHLSTRWDPENCHPQCWRCNKDLRGNLSAYSVYLLNRFGTGILHRLEGKKRDKLKLYRADLLALIEIYREKLRGFDARDAAQPAPEGVAGFAV